MQPGNPVVGGVVLRRVAIQSPNYVPATSGWAVFQDGTAEFNNVTIRGDIIVGPLSGTHIVLNQVAGTETFYASDGTTAVITLNGGGLVPILVQGSGTVLFATVTGNNFPSFALTSAGRLEWGDGTGNVRDVTLARSAANQLTFGGGANVQLLAGGNTICTAENGVSNVATTAGSDTTTSATYVNMAGTGAVTSFSFTKLYTATRVRVDIAGSLFSTVAATVVDFAVLLNGTDTTLCGTNINAANTHLFMTGFAYIGGSIAAGTYTVQARWKRVSGTGTLTRDTNDWLSFSAREVTP